MKLEIQLKDPAYCDKCPCFQLEYGYCRLRFTLDNLTHDLRQPRPKKCIRENGE